MTDSQEVSGTAAKPPPNESIRPLSPPLELLPTVQHYDWGGKHYIPELMGHENPEGRPWAELWIGAHPKSPSRVRLSHADMPLDQLIRERAIELLGDATVRRFGWQLPFLFKVLDVEKMLSIQVHPTKEQAEAGFARENALGISLDAPQRNYRDANHKPELHVALSEFWMLHGFRPLEEIAHMVHQIKIFERLLPGMQQRLRRAADSGEERSPVRDLYIRVMTMPQAEVDAILGETLTPYLQAYEAEDLEKDSPYFWALRAAQQFKPKNGRYDRGIFSVFLLNLVHLRPGEGTFQPAGTLHAYLEGQNLEVMANSDNVLRGGLTTKHVDIPELLQIVCFEAHHPEILHGENISKTECRFSSPADEFQLSRIELDPTPYYAPEDHGLEICLVMEGEVIVRINDRAPVFRRGQVFLIPAGRGYSLHAADRALLFKAFVPHHTRTCG